MKYQKIVTSGLGIFRELIFLLLICHSLSFAQDMPYYIGPRDVLTLTIFAGGEKQHEADLTINEYGEINVPFIGSIRAEGLTTSRLEELIRFPLAQDYFVDPEVNIYIKEYHSLRYYIAGMVNAPGLYETSTRATLMKLIAKAGGVSTGRGNVAYILRDATTQVENGENIETLLSSTKEPLKVDLKRLLDRGDMSYDIMLQSGDVVYIPPENTLDVAESSIYVEGQVKKPGIYAYQPGLTALNACIIAGGFGKFAAPNRTKIIRKKGERQVIIRINLNEVKEGKKLDIELKPGDLINVPETWL